MLCKDIEDKSLEEYKEDVEGKKNEKEEGRK